MAKRRRSRSRTASVAERARVRPPEPFESDAALQERLAAPAPVVGLPRAKNPARHALPKGLSAELRRQLCAYPDSPAARAYTRKDIQIAAWMGRIYPGHLHCFHKACRRAGRCRWKPDQQPPAQWGEAEWAVYARMRYLVPHCIIPLWYAGFQEFVCQIIKEAAAERLVQTDVEG